MRKQLSFRRLTLFVLSVLFLAAVTVAGIGIGKSTQALAEDAPECEHVLGEMHTVKAQTCVEPGIGVRYCKDCHGAFNVVIPADGVSHPKVNAEGECEVCGATDINFVIDQEKSTENEIVVKGVPEENSDVTKIVIPAKIDEKPVYVSEDAFAGNEKIQSVTIQGSPFIGASAFEGCTNLSEVIIEGTQEGTQTIASNAFKDCESLEKVDLPESVTSVGADAFTGTAFYNDTTNWQGDDLKTLKSGNCLLKVAASAPAVPQGRKHLRMNEEASLAYSVASGITVIADEAFAGLSDLAEVTLPDGILTVGFNAFKGTAVRSVILPASAQNIVGLNGEGFKIYYLGSTAEWEKIGAQVPQSDVYFYAADEKNTLADNNYWYYGEDNLPTPYIKLSGISFGKEPKKEYLLGEPFVFDGAVNADYVNGTSDEIPNDRLDIDYSEFKSNQTGSYKITISYAYCELEYTVTVTDAYIVTIDYGYNIPNGTASVEILKEGEASNYTLPAAPARTGYTFTGWLFNGETKPAETPVIVESNLTITAQWERLTPAITMDYVGGTWTENDGYTVSAYDEASDSYTVTITAEPTRTGYIFKGWTYALKDAEPADVENNTFTIKLADDMAYTVTAVWEARTPVITLNYAEGEEGTAKAAYGPLSEDSKYTVTVTGEPTRTGWKFIGWAAAYNGAPAELVADNGVYTYTFDLADEMTLALTAQWEQLYTVTVGTTEHAKVEIRNAQEYYETGTAVTFTVKVDSGYKLSTVSVGTLGEDGVYTFNVEKANVTIDVTTEQVTVTVIVAGENASDENVKFTQDASAHFTLDALTRDGYTFNGWIVKVGENAASETPVNGSYELPLANSDVTVTFTADWTANDYHLFVEGAEHATVTYEDNTNEPKSAYHITDTVKFKVAANEGYVLDSVKQGEAVLQADEDGYYSVTFGAADITVTVQTTQKTVTLSDLSVTAQENNIVLSVKVAYTGYTEEQISAAQLKYGENSIGGTFAEEKLTYTLTPATLQKGNVFTLSVDGTVIAISVEINETVEIGPTTYTFSIVDGNLTLSTNEADIQYTVASVKLASEAENITLTVTLTITNGVSVHNATLTVGEASATAAVQENVLTFTLAAAELQNGALTLKVNGLSGEWGDAQVEGSPLILNQKEYALDNENGLTLTVTQLYTVTVNPVGEGGTAELTDGKKDYYKTGDSVTLTVTVNKGYKLVSVKNGESELGTDGTYTVTVGTENITLTVTIEQISITSKVVGAEGVTLNVVKDGAKATVTVNGEPKKTGYTFNGWTVTVGGASKDYTEELVIELGNVDIEVVYTATWTRLEPQVTVDLGGAQGSVTTSYQFNEEANTYTVTISGTPAYAEHRFDGWTLAGAVEAELTAEQTTFTVALSDNMTVTLTAKWVEQVTVTYALGDHAAENAEVPTAVTVDKNGTVNLPAAPQAAEGYEFAGWKVGSDETLREADYELKVTASVTVTAQWTAVYTLTVTGADNADVTYDGQKTTYHAGDVVTITINPAAGYKVTAEGITVVGAEKKVEGNVITITFANSNVTVSVTVAQVTVTVAFAETYEGVSGSATVNGATATVEITGTPSKEGFVFTGWTSTIQGDATQGDNVLTYNLKNSDVTITFTAQFEKKEVTEVNATLTASGNTVSLKLTLGYTGYTEAGVEKFQLKIGEDRTITGTFAEKALTFALPEDLAAGTFALQLLDGDKDVFSGKTFSGSSVQFVATTGLEYNLASGEIVVTFYGTMENPLSVEAALTIGETQCPSENDWSRHQIYVTGKLTENPTSADATSIQFELVDQKNDQYKIKVWKPTTKAGVAEPAQNDILIVYGWIENYKGLELQGFGSKDVPSIEKNERGQSTITLGEHEGATVEKFGSAESLTATNGTTFSFTVVPEAGKKVNTVMAGAETLTADSGNTYSFTVKGNVTITITTMGENEESSKTATMQYSGTTTGNLSNTDNNAKTVGLDEKIFTVTSDKTTSSNQQVGINKNGTIRLYKNKTVTLGIEIASGYTIESIKVTLSGGDTKNTVAKLDDLVVNGATQVSVDTNKLEGLYNVNETKVTLSNQNGSNQIWIISIVITYKSTSGSVEPEPEPDYQGKVDQVHEALQIDKTELTENLTLPTTDVEGVNLEWSVTVDTAGADANSAKIVGDVLQIVRGKTDIVITLKVVITCGETARSERTWTLTIKAETGGGTVEVLTFNFSSVSGSAEKTSELKSFLEGYISEGLNKNITTITGTKVFQGTNAIKLGSGSYTGSIVFTFNVNVTKISVDWATYSNDSGHLTVSDGKITQKGNGGNKKTTSSEEEFSFSSPTKSITLASSAKRVNIKSIKITFETASDEVQSDLEIVPAVYNGPVSTIPSDTAANSALWISLVSVGVVLLAIGAVVVVFSLRKKSE